MNAENELFLSRENAVLAVIDMQGKLLAVMHERERILGNVLKLVRFAGVIGLPVLVTEQQNLGATVPEIRAELPGFKPVPKMEFDVVTNPEFMSRLEALGRTQIVLAGIESHICITQTALHLLPRYRVYAVSDAVSSRSRDDRETALQRMRQAGVIIASTEMVIFELVRKGGTDDFRAALKLIK